MDASPDSFAEFVAVHLPQLTASGIPQCLWQRLFEKLDAQIFDAGNVFTMQRLESAEVGHVVGDLVGLLENDRLTPREVNGVSELVQWRVVVTANEGLRCADPDCVYLVDHAWTFRVGDARKHLLDIPGLLERMCALMNVDPDLISHLPKHLLVDFVMKHMWQYNQTYSAQSSDLTFEECLPVWYIMDEFGCRIGHSENPSAKVVPFYYVPHSMAFNILFLCNDLDLNDEVTRSYVELSDYHKPEWRNYYRLPWFPEDHSRESFGFISEFNENHFESFRENERLPESTSASAQADSDSVVTVPKGQKLKVFTEYDKIAQNLRHPSFELADKRENSDVWFLRHHFKDYHYLATSFPNVLINQFPFESVLTVKDLFASAVHSAFGSGSLNEETMENNPPWFAVTYNLVKELPQMVSCFQNRKKRHLDNVWILKPWNLARSLDTYVTDQLSCIIRSIETGPKIACKYIENPVLFDRPGIGACKFDMRFIILVLSVKPLKAYVYDRFWLRFANKPFSLDHFDDYEKHFTVMNYVGSNKIKQMFCSDFIRELSRQYPTMQWRDVYASCCGAMREALEVASRCDPPRGIAANRQCRAMYGVDVMLKWSSGSSEGGDEKAMQPVILEFNFMPDCERACNYYPDFMNTVCQVLFTDDASNCPVTEL